MALPRKYHEPPRYTLFCHGSVTAYHEFSMAGQGSVMAYHELLHDIPWAYHGVQYRYVRVSCQGHGIGMACHGIAMVLQRIVELKDFVFLGLYRRG